MRPCPQHTLSRCQYANARSRIRTGDLLLFRPTGFFASRLIRTAGRSPYSHAAMAAWIPVGETHRLLCLETVEFKGGRAVLLSNRLARYRGEIDVFVPWPPGDVAFDPQQAFGAMLEITGKPYGWGSIARAALVHLPLVRLIVPVETDDTANGSLPFCSQAFARGWRAGHLDPVPNLADRLTEPGDLARSAAARYMLTLVP